MASTNKTTNYELSQFIETDKPGWLTDYNGDMRKLDTALKGVSDVASGASSSISSLTDRMTAAEGAISTNANDIDALEARADVLEAQAQSTAGTIANIQTEQTAQNLGIEAATELGYNLARPYDSASTYAVGAYVLFQNTLYKCITAVPVGEAFVPAKWLAIKAMDEVGNGNGYEPISISDYITLGSSVTFEGDILLFMNKFIFLAGIFRFPLTTSNYILGYINERYNPSGTLEFNSNIMRVGIAGTDHFRYDTFTIVSNTGELHFRFDFITPPSSTQSFQQSGYVRMFYPIAS